VFPVPADVGNYFGLAVNQSVDTFQYYAPSLENSIDVFNRSGSSSSESYVASVWTSPELLTPPTAESYTASPLDVLVETVVESNYDPNLHFDKYWLETGEMQSNHQFMAEPLICDEVVEPIREMYSTIEVTDFLEHLANSQSYESSLETAVPSSICEESSVELISTYVVPEYNYNVSSPAESQTSSIDPGLFHANATDDDNMTSCTGDSTQVHVSSHPQYFPYAETRVASPPLDFQYSQYLVPDFETEALFSEWDSTFLDAESTQFFEGLLFQ
jgi:hypothetical protein